jgi:catecholate siderophore receptor
VRDDVQYYRDLYNLDRVEVLRGPNAMIFGRGGGGGIINRVTKEAGFTQLREISLLAGSFNNKRVTGDFNRPFNDKVAIRGNVIYENSKSFRNRVDLERYGINPTLTFAPTKQTRFTFGYERFGDTRVADRGISSPGSVTVAIETMSTIITAIGKLITKPILCRMPQQQIKLRDLPRLRASIKRLEWSSAL